MIFQYKALNNKGESVSDFIDATSETAAKQKIKSQGLYLVSLKKHDVLRDEKSGLRVNRIRRLLEKFSDVINRMRSIREVGIFSRQLATLLKAGLPLPTAITDIIEQIENKYFRNIIVDIKEKIVEGSSFSNALARHNSVFSDMYINMVRVGENLGSLDHVIERLADIEEKKNILKSKIRAALWYPAFMFLFATAVVVFLLVTVIPNIAEIFTDQKQKLPLPTEIVMGVSDFFSNFWYVFPIVFIILFYFYDRYSKTPEGRKKIDEIKLKLPLVKNLYKKMLVYRFTQNLGILMNNKVEIIKSFEIVEKIVGNVVIEEKIVEASKNIKEGASVSIALKNTDFLPKMVLGMISAGEASDSLDTMMINIGQVYETEIDLTVTSLTSLIEPIVIIIMGVAIGSIVMAVMLPIMEMNLLIQ